MNRLYTGDTVQISNNLKEIYEMRGWEYNPTIHENLIGQQGQICSIEDKYCYDYCYVKFQHYDYNGTLPVQALIKIE
jgi:hypothetical protein